MLKQGDIVTLSIHKREGVCGEVVEDFVQCSVRCIDVHNNIVYLDDNSNPIYKNTYILNLNTSINGRHTEEPTPSLDIEKWGSFKVSELFEVEASKDIDNRTAKENKGTTPYLTTSGTDNGVQCYTSIEPFYSGNKITIAGSGTVLSTFYQPIPFVTSQRLYVLSPKFNLNKYIAMFIIPLVEANKSKFSQGRQVRIGHIKDLVIKLPITKEGTPDWEFMEKYIKTLKYSKEL